MFYQWVKQIFIVSPAAWHVPCYIGATSREKPSGLYHMEQELIIEIVSQQSPTAQEDEAAALNLIAGLFAERILRAARLELGLAKEDEFSNGATTNYNGATTNYRKDYPPQSNLQLFL